MTEDEAQCWILTRFGEPARATLAEMVRLVTDEAQRQNLVASSTLATIWARHIVDSAQLIDLAPGGSGLWMDVGTGAGFPGMVVAVLRSEPMLLVEPRRKRADFLAKAVAELGLAGHANIVCSAIESVRCRAGVISARAVASLDRVIATSVHCALPTTCWLLPKGRNARVEVAAARESWHGVFHVEPSVTDVESLIVLASEVSRR